MAACHKMADTVFIHLPHLSSTSKCHGLTRAFTDEASRKLVSLWIISNCCLPRAGLEFCRAAVVLLSGFHPAFSETFWASLTWSYECLIVVYIYRLLSHDQFTTMCPLIWDNVDHESVQEYFIGNACRSITAIQCCVIVSDAWVDYIPN